MAEQIISPGVFTRENDLTFLPQGVGQIGAAIVGPTVKGPAFVPTVVRSFAEYERRFGGLSSETFVPQTVREYLKNAGSVTVCRVLAGGGYTYASGTNSPVVIAAGPAKATATISFSGNPSETKVITLVDADGTSKTFEADVDGNGAAGSNIALVPVGSSNAQFVDELVSEINGESDLAITATELTSTSILLTMDVNGTAGNTTITTDFNNATVPAAFTGGQDAILLSVIYPSKALVTPDLSLSTSMINRTMSESFGLHLKGATGGTLATTGTRITGSMNPASNDYIPKILGSNSNNSKTGTVAYNGTPGHIGINFKSLQSKIQSATLGTNAPGYSLNVSSSVTCSLLATNLVYSGLSGTEEKYSYASTPFITSQFLEADLSGVMTPGTEKQLFKFHTLSHGSVCNKDYKISITNLREPADIDGVEQYTTFTVLVRKYSDKDDNPLVVEEYKGVNLNPDSPNYISRKIGDRYPQYNDVLDKVELLGNYPNISSHIRVEVHPSVEAKSYNAKLSPKGFEQVTNPFRSAAITAPVGTLIFPSASYEATQSLGTDNTYNTKGFLGWRFTDKEPDNENFHRPLPDSAEGNVAGNFNVENHFGHASSSLWAGSLSASIDPTGAQGPTAGQLKFSVPFQGGDDGIRPDIVRLTGAETDVDGVSAYSTNKTNLFGFDVSATSKAGYIGYKKALDTLSNQDEYDINMLALPGVLKEYHSLITTKAIDMVEGRGDTFYVMDLANKESSVNNAVSVVSGLDSNYTAVYYPWVKVLDSAVNKPILVPPSVVVPGAIAASDRIAAEWFAPAGLNRGVLGNVIEAKLRLNQSERDILYNEKINPIATFPQTGVCIWGQKTLQERPTALDRINVRRLLIALKKFIASSSRYLLFEQNTLDTRARFLNIVNPYLESVQSRQGLFSFRVVMDESNNTPDVIDRNQLVGAIYLQPTRTAEFIVLDFNVMPTGATFDGGGSAGGY